MPLTDDEVRQAWEWYQAEPGRTWREAAAHFHRDRGWLKRRAAALGLPSRRRYLDAEGRANGPRMTYQRVVDAYRAGQSVRDLARSYDLWPELVLDILRSAGELCARCEILLARNEPYGIAVLATGDRVCQECVEESGCEVERWEREPVAHNVVDAWEWRGG